ncbi:hypothetical protein A5744_11825 [Mycobacterium sp. IS-1264]|nr:hypothetical protein A5744_11825 [Mycobacterium sp. IS-1264]
MHQIHCRRGLVGVVEVRPADAAQPEPPVGVAGPHERAVVELRESGDPTDKALLIGLPTYALPEPTHAEPASAVDGGLRLDGVVARSHRRAVDGDQVSSPLR